ncbi:MAG: NAD(P)H-binding protein [Crocinitomicaceae bacterium]|nr:NAD(P)H-binding protein [Crocinitomicaceae bacterium]
MLKEALAKDYQVTILVRNTKAVNVQHKNLTIVEGNVLDNREVNKVLQNQDAVIQCLGVNGKGDGKPTTFVSDANKIIMDECQNQT